MPAFTHLLICKLGALRISSEITAAKTLSTEPAHRNHGANGNTGGALEFRGRAGRALDGLVFVGHDGAVCRTLHLQRA